MARKLNQNQSFFLESASASAVAITGITNADPAVVSHSGTDPSNGDYVRLSGIQGLINEAGEAVANNQIFRVSNAAAGSFELEGLDTSSPITAFIAEGTPTFQVITFGTEIDDVQEADPGDSSVNRVEVTGVTDDRQVFLAGLQPAITYTLTIPWDVSSSSYQALRAASRTKATLAFMKVHEDGQRELFQGQVSFDGASRGGTGELTTTTAEFFSQGKTNQYAT